LPRGRRAIRAGGRNAHRIGPYSVDCSAGSQRRIAGTDGALAALPPPLRPDIPGISMVDKIGDPLHFHQSVLNLRAYRQQLLASNIANADTPNYKARDIDFKAALAGALDGRTEGLVLVRTAAGHLPSAPVNPFATAVMYRGELQSSVDGNTVNTDVERARFAENAVHYEADLTFISGYLRTLNTAITGQ
jgi:flagellar basal-body rod protein FlgB